MCCIGASVKEDWDDVYFPAEIWLPLTFYLEQEAKSSAEVLLKLKIAFLSLFLLFALEKERRSRLYTSVDTLSSIEFFLLIDLNGLILTSE
jgi:hypothetical protein